MEQQLTLFLADLADKRQYSENTIAAYRNDLNQLLKFLHDSKFPVVDAWADVSAPIIEEYVASLRARDYTSSTIARKIAAMKSFFHYLNAQHILSDDPTAGLDSPKVKKNPPRALAPEDINRLLTATTRATGPKALRDRAILQLLYATGMRVTELVSLQLEDLDLGAGVVVCQSRAGRDREMPLDAGAVVCLSEYLDSARPQLATEDSGNALFLNHRGQQLTRQGLWLIIKAYAQEANLDVEVTPHTLRHSFAAHMLHNGADLREVQKRLGHANLSTTQIYSQMVDEQP